MWWGWTWTATRCAWEVCIGAAGWSQWLGSVEPVAGFQEQAKVVNRACPTSRTHRQMPIAIRPAFPRPQYDKFHLRGCIDALLMELWRDPTCGQSLTAAAQSRGGEAGVVQAHAFSRTFCALSTARGAEQTHCPAGNIWSQPGAFDSPTPLPSTPLRSAVCRLCGCGAERPHVPAQRLAAGGRVVLPCLPPALRVFSASRSAG